MLCAFLEQDHVLVSCGIKPERCRVDGQCLTDSRSVHVRMTEMLPKTEITRSIPAQVTPKVGNHKTRLGMYDKHRGNLRRGKLTHSGVRLESPISPNLLKRELRSDALPRHTVRNYSLRPHAPSRVGRK